MTHCDRIRADAPGIAALRRDDPERIAALSHASGCAGCARALREATRLQSVLGDYQPPPLPADALQRVSQEIRARLRRDARRRLLGSVAAVSASVLVFVGLGRSPSRSPWDWAIAALLWATAVILAASAGRNPRLATALAVLAAVGAAAISGAPGPLDVSLGVACVATEVAAGAIVAGAVWLSSRGTSSPAGSAMAAAASAGALAGDAALQITCAAHTAFPHVLAFHVGGVLIAAAGAAVLWRSAQRVTSLADR